MEFNKLTPAIIDELRAAVGDDAVITDDELLKPFASDYTEDLVFMPEVAVLPQNREQIQAMMRIAFAGYCASAEVAMQASAHATANDPHLACAMPPPLLHC